MKDSPAYNGTCAQADFSKEKYYKDDETTLRSLSSFNFMKVRKLSSVLNWRSLYCFTGWGLVSKVSYS